MAASWHVVLLRVCKLLRYLFFILLGPTTMNHNPNNKNCPKHKSNFMPTLSDWILRRENELRAERDAAQFDLANAKVEIERLLSRDVDVIAIKYRQNLENKVKELTEEITDEKCEIQRLWDEKYDLWKDINKQNEAHATELAEARAEMERHKRDAHLSFQKALQVATESTCVNCHKNATEHAAQLAAIRTAVADYMDTLICNYPLSHRQSDWINARARLGELLGVIESDGFSNYRSQP